ncbi:MAG: hypothetical protein LBB40_00420 [Holophagales bacterium]|jgi:hypothetical protein|nr:hypothetical protein [Holophagales bacterium]
MRQRTLLSILTPALLVFSTGCIFIASDSKKTNSVAPAISLNANGSTNVTPSLLVIWSSADREVAMQTCLTYVENAVKNKWFNGTTLIVWGPSVKLLANDRELQAKIELIIDRGAKVQACAETASSYGVADKLKELGIDVKPIDMPLTGILKTANTRVITF